MDFIYQGNFTTDTGITYTVIRIDFFQDVSDELQEKFNEIFEKELPLMHVMLNGSFGGQHYWGEFYEPDMPVLFKTVDDYIRSALDPFRNDIEQIIFHKKLYLKTTTHFRAYIEREISDMQSDFHVLFPQIDFSRDYENKWEWIHGENEIGELYVNVSRTHNWKSGIYSDPLHIKIGSKEITKTEIERLGNALSKQLKTPIVYTDNDAEIERTFLYHEE